MISQRKLAFLRGWSARRGLRHRFCRVFDRQRASHADDSRRASRRMERETPASRARDERLGAFAVVGADPRGGASAAALGCFCAARGSLAAGLSYRPIAARAPGVARRRHRDLDGFSAGGAAVPGADRATVASGWRAWARRDRRVVCRRLVRRAPGGSPRRSMRWRRWRSPSSLPWPDDAAGISLSACPRRCAAPCSRSSGPRISSISWTATTDWRR